MVLNQYRCNAEIVKRTPNGDRIKYSINYNDDLLYTYSIENFRSHMHSGIFGLIGIN